MIEALQGLFGGLAQGTGDINARRQQQAQEALRRQEADRLMKQQQFAQLQVAYGTVQPGQDIDPVQAQQFSQAGFSVVKSPTGGMTVPTSIQDRRQQMELDNAILSKEINELKLSESRRHREFLDSLQNPSKFESFMRAPRHVREMTWKSMGMEGNPPLTNEELAQEDIAKSQGDIALQKVQNAGTIGAANARLGGSNVVNPAQYEQWKAAYLKSNPSVHSKFLTDSRKDPALAQEWEQAFQNEFMKVRSLPQ